MKNKNLVYIFIIMSICALLIGCAQNPGTISHEPSRGALYLTIADEDSSRTFEPVFDDLPASYHVMGTGPGTESIDQTITSNTVTITSLVSGSWTITVDGFYADGTKFTTGTTTAFINAGVTTPIEVTLNLIDGPGEFVLDVEWFETDLYDPVIDAVLKDSAGVETPLVFVDASSDIGKTKMKVITGDSLDSGYYTLILKLIDKGISGTENKIVVGVVEAVKIVKAQTTYGSYSFEKGLQSGAMTINVIRDFDEVIDVFIKYVDTMPNLLRQGSGLTVPVTASIPEDDADEAGITYAWYINGEAVGTGQTYAVNADLSPLSYHAGGSFTSGCYYLSVVAFNTDGSRGGSASYKFFVTDENGGINAENAHKIVFESNVDSEQKEIKVVNPDGTGLVQLTNNTVTDYAPKWSPDKTKILFTAKDPDTAEIYVMNADGTGRTRLTTSAGVDSYGSWSPNGEKIIFHSERSGNYDIFVMDADGSNVVQLTTDINLDKHPVWSPCGTKIAFVSKRNGSENIYVMNADGTDITRLTLYSANNVPQWSPDGKTIVYHSNKDSDWNIYIMNADGTNQIRYTSESDTETFPCYSPDGSQIIYHRNMGDFWTLWIMNADSSNQHQLFSEITFNSNVPGW